MRPAIFRNSPDSSDQAGFTLVEVVIGIVVAAIALAFITSLFFSNAGRSVEPVLQIRAAEFGQALMDEIIAKPFDEQTPLGGVPACDPCTPFANFGADAAETRSNFDDVDDYDNYCGSPGPLIDSFGVDISSNTGDPFFGYRMEVCVTYDSDYDGINDGAAAHVGAVAKRIRVDIYPPTGAGMGGTPITFSAYRGNY